MLDPFSAVLSVMKRGTIHRMEYYVMLELLEKTKDFTAKAKEAFLQGHTEALRLGQSAVSSEHLLLGLLRVEDTIALRILSRLEISPVQVREEVESHVSRGEKRLTLTEMMRPILTSQLERALHHAREEANLLGCSNISTAYLLLGLLRENDGVVSQVFVQFDAHLYRIRAIVAENPNE